MTYTSFVFLIFLLVTGIFYYIVPKKAQWVVLLIASLVFYFFSSQFLGVFIVLSALLIFLGARQIQKYGDEFKLKKKGLERAEKKELKAKTQKKQKAVLTTVVVLNIAVLAALKYCNFFGDIINGISHLFGGGKLIPLFSVVLTLGISYYTLMAVSYIVDVYRGTIQAEKNPFRLLLFLSYFPHISEGPFDRYGDMDKQFREPHYLDFDVIKNGGILMMYGFFKKLVIADRLGFIVNGIFDNADILSGTSILIGILGYTLQLYCDFSGCIDIVSGVSEMFGVKLAENFRQPFFSRSINEFWRRWHITLGLWLKEYVFYPVSLSNNFKKVNTSCRKHIKNEFLTGMIPAAYALFFVWFCNGLWHGASGKYIFYGLYYYILMMLGEFTKPLTDKLCTKIKLNRDTKWYHGFQIFRTFVIVNVGMLIFRSATLADSWHYLAQLFTTRPNFVELFNDTIKIPHISNKDYALLVVATIAIYVIGKLKENGHDIRLELSQKNLVFRWLIYLVLMFTVIITGFYGGAFGDAGMIYGQF